MRRKRRSFGASWKAKAALAGVFWLDEGDVAADGAINSLGRPLLGKWRQAWIGRQKILSVPGIRIAKPTTTQSSTEIGRVARQRIDAIRARRRSSLDRRAADSPPTMTPVTEAPIVFGATTRLIRTAGGD